MAQNERFASSGHRAATAAPARPKFEEQVLKMEKLQVERKVFTFSLRENPRGRFLRITEDVAGRRDHIIVPAPGLAEFARVLKDIANAAAALAPPPPAAPDEGATTPPPAAE